MKQLIQHISEWRYNKSKMIVSIAKDFNDLTRLINIKYEANPHYLDLRDIDVSNIKDFNQKNVYLVAHRRHKQKQAFELYGLFAGCDSEVIDVTGWKLDNAYDISNMFYHCESLKEIKGIDDWDVSNVTDIRWMFLGCENLRNINLSKWKFKGEVEMDDTFKRCDNSIIPSWYRGDIS